MIKLPLDIAYFAFAMMVFAVFLVIYWRRPAYRRQMNQMAFFGGIGGILISQLYRQDFWNPPSLMGFHLGSLYVALEDYVFGGTFIGIVTVLVQMATQHHLETESVKSATRAMKQVMLGAILALGLTLKLAGLGSMATTILPFLLGAFFVSLWRPDLLSVIIRGGILTLLVYMLLVSFFVFVIAANADALGRGLSPHYVKYGMKTAMTLGLWAFSFGAFFAPFYAVMANKRYVPN